MRMPVLSLSVFPTTLTCPTLAALALVLSGQNGSALLLRHFDHVALKWDTGEAVADSTNGVVATPAPVNEGAVNFLKLDSIFPIFITSDPQTEGTLSFGLVDRNAWTPMPGDGKDLFRSTDIGDRVYVNVHHDGAVELISAPHHGAGKVLDSTVVTLEATHAFSLDLDVTGKVARVWYGDQIILDGLPFGDPEAADPARVGSDFAISSTCLCDTGEERVSFSINDRAKGPRLAISRFPQVLSEEAGLKSILPDDLFLPRGYDILTASETVGLAIHLENIGSETADNVAARLVVPAGAGMSVIGDATRSYGSLTAGTATVRNYRLRTDGTPVGVHQLLLEVTGSSTQTLATPVVVWEAEPRVIDLAAGMASVTAETPFERIQVDFKAPETRVLGVSPQPFFSANSFPFRFHFDLQQLEARVLHRIPFFGKHPGEPYITAPRFVMQAQAGPEAAQRAPARFVELKIKVKDSNGQPILNTFIEIEVQFFGGRKTTIQGRLFNGEADFDDFWELGPGNYCFRVKSARDGSIIKGGERKEIIEAAGTYEVNICYPAVPPGGSNAPAPTGPPANAQRTGTEAGASAPAPPKPSAPPPPPQPAPTPPPAPARAEPTKTGRSAGVGVLTFLGTGALNVAGLVVSSPTGPGAVGGAAFASGFGSTLLGGAAGWAADPMDQDLFFVAREQTPPLEPDETTREETISLELVIAPFLSTEQPSVISNQFRYVRTTDRRTYTYSGSEVIRIESILDVDLSVSKTEFVFGEQPVLTVTVDAFDGTALRSSQVLVTAYLLDDLGIAGAGLLNDDGQGFDPLERDGEFTGVIPVGRRSVGYAYVLAMASRSGFYDGEVPGSFGMASQRVRFSGGANQLTINRSGGFVSITWSEPGVLEETPLTAPLMWRSLPAVQSPHVIVPMDSGKLFRLRQNPLR